MVRRGGGGLERKLRGACRGSGSRPDRALLAASAAAAAGAFDAAARAERGTFRLRLSDSRWLGAAGLSAAAAAASTRRFAAACTSQSA